MLVAEALTLRWRCRALVTRSSNSPSRPTEAREGQASSGVGTVGGEDGTEALRECESKDVGLSALQGVGELMRKAGDLAFGERDSCHMLSKKQPQVWDKLKDAFCCSRRV